MQFEIYLSALRDHRPPRKLDGVRKTILYQVLTRYESSYSISRSSTRPREYELGDAGRVQITKLKKTPAAVKAAVKNLAKDGLITRVSQKEKEKTHTDWERFELNQREPKHYRVSEYGIYHILANETLYPFRLIPDNWESAVIQTLVAPYFSEETVLHATPDLHFAIVKFIKQSCQITDEILEAMHSDAEKKAAKLSEYAASLERKLQLHAKLFALQMLGAMTVAENASRDRDGNSNLSAEQLTSQLLLQDPVFNSFAGKIVDEIVAVYHAYPIRKNVASGRSWDAA